MKSKSEVARILGVSRRTLDRYDDMDLLKPTVKDNQTCLYDNEAIQKLILIEIFRQAGYKRLEIKEFIDNKKGFIKEYDIVLKKLMDQQHKIENMIKNLGMLKVSIYFPESVSYLIESWNFPELYQNCSFQEMFEQNIKSNGLMESDTLENKTIPTEIFKKAALLGLQKSKNINSEEVRESFHAFIDSLIIFWDKLNVKGNDKDELNQIPKENFSRIFLEKELKILEQYDFSKKLNSLFGPGTYDFVRDVFKTYSVTRNEVMEKLSKYRKEMEG